ncbi:hypothetical protein [Ruminococcus sp.]|uniref:hypothetical protein n=1 Tax=Ruminococcus sp. TaxID=41978 RepID=UPI0025E20F89|nr:hypothetical protein [Ruminococcus sp.]MBR1431754.1 hypothetical protein [Ruminococcus sp.]
MNVELKRLMRHQRYVIERDSAKGVLHYGSEEELYKMSPCGIYEYEQEQREAEYRALLRKAMYLALRDLKEWNHYWYELVTAYYLTEPQPTLAQLGARYGVTRQAVTKSIRKGMTVLRCHANIHLRELINE